MTLSQFATLSGRQKSAILLISLGTDIAAEVYKHLSEEEIDQLYENLVDGGQHS